MTLGIVNQLEDKKESAVQFEKPILHDVGLIYLPISTYRTSETQQCTNKSENTHMTSGTANQLDDRKGSTVLVGKPEIHVEKVHKAPQKALSNQLEHQDSYRTYVDEHYVKINEPARTGGSSAISSQK